LLVVLWEYISDARTCEYSIYSVVRMNTIKAYGGSGSRAPIILNLRRIAVNFTLRLSTRGEIFRHTQVGSWEVTSTTWMVDDEEKLFPLP